MSEFNVELEEMPNFFLVSFIEHPYSTITVNKKTGCVQLHEYHREEIPPGAMMSPGFFKKFRLRSNGSKSELTCVYGENLEHKVGPVVSEKSDAFRWLVSVNQLLAMKSIERLVEELYEANDPATLNLKADKTAARKVFSGAKRVSTPEIAAAIDKLWHEERSKVSECANEVFLDPSKFESPEVLTNVLSAFNIASLTAINGVGAASAVSLAACGYFNLRQFAESSLDSLIGCSHVLTDSHYIPGESRLKTWHEQAIRLNSDELFRLEVI